MDGFALTLWPIRPAEPRDSTWSPPMPTHPPQVASFTKAVWFLLGLEGGRWGTGEIFDKLKPSGWNRRNAAKYIADMAYSGLLERYPGAEGRVSYGVTRSCKIPRGLTLAEIEQLSGIRFVEEAAPCERALTA
jgi:hypothetical protein